MGVDEKLIRGAQRVHRIGRTLIGRMAGFLRSGKVMRDANSGRRRVVV